MNDNEIDEWDTIDIPVTITATATTITMTPEQQRAKAEKEALEAQKKAIAEEKRAKILAENAETARLNQLWKDEQKALKAAERKIREEKEAEEIRQKELARKKLEEELGTPEKIFKHDFKISNKHKFVHQKVNRNGGAPVYTGMNELEAAADKAWKLRLAQAC